MCDSSFGTSKPCISYGPSNFKPTLKANIKESSYMGEIELMVHPNLR